jgi:hypothetical protein
MTDRLYTCLAPRTDWRTRPPRVVVRIVCRWRKWSRPAGYTRRGPPRNVAVRDEHGHTWVRPFRGIRRVDA